MEDSVCKNSPKIHSLALNATSGGFGLSYLSYLYEFKLKLADCGVIPLPSILANRS
jgi:hypothetical protein